jgi:hypothetical protein
MYACNGHLVSYCICSCRDTTRARTQHFTGCTWTRARNTHTYLSKTRSTVHVWCLRVTCVCARMLQLANLLAVTFPPPNNADPQQKNNLAPQTAPVDPSKAGSISDRLLTLSASATEDTGCDAHTARWIRSCRAHNHFHMMWSKGSCIYVAQVPVNLSKKKSAGYN